MSILDKDVSDGLGLGFEPGLEIDGLIAAIQTNN